MGSQYWKKDNTGKRFGNMVVLCDSGMRKNRKVVWECQCDCGNIFYARSDHINTGSTKSCPSCAQKKNIDNLLLSQNMTKRNIQVGDQYGKLTIIGMSDRKSSSGSYYWKCQCDCGTITEVDSGHWGKTQSCGCIRSIGETKIRQILLDNKIAFETEKTFKDCYYPDTGGVPRFDFYLPDYNLLIEFDGKQHYESTNLFWCTDDYVEKLKIKDAYKQQWAVEHNIKFKRIPYYILNQLTIDDLLS